VTLKKATPGVRGAEGLEGVSSTRHPSKEIAPNSKRPATALADAFLRALFAWARRQTRDQRITLPAGAVDPNELRQVLVNLLCARNEQRGAA
jgi:hypothetical protein